MPSKADGVNGFAQSFQLMRNSAILQLNQFINLKAQLVAQAELYF